MSLKEQLAKQTGIGLLIMGFSTFFAAISFFLISRILEREEIAYIGIAAGLLAMLSPILLSPEVILFRDYAAFKKNTNKYVSAFLFFWLVRSIFIMGVISVISYLLYAKDNFQLFLYVVGAGLIMCFSMLHASIQELCFVEFKQVETLRLNFIYYAIFLVGLIYIYFNRDIMIYLVVLMLSSFALALLWLERLFRVFRFVPVFDVRALETLLKTIISGVGMWSHLISSSIQLIYRADLFFLGLFVTAFVTGNYTIALMFSSLFVFVPQVLQKMCIAGLTRSVSKPEDMKIVNAFLKYTFVLSIIQVAGYVLLGKFIISFIDAQNADSIFQLGLFLVIGTNIFNVIRPIHSYAFARANLKQLLVHVFLPAGILAVIFYSVAAYAYGGLVTAQANVLVYVVLVLIYLRYAFSKMKFQLSLQWITREEWLLLQKILKRFHIRMDRSV
ncbi:MAG: hypothetical protein IPJ89_02805 [Candidatus Iainarchaeum archaeon]|uniref:Polysaccharide biosynthesis protein C-terminal domain-containing protein n=1 Tax=Candidatus Iainarchaeum sp. TaxID=3101447 RepID=A0A7T9I2V1_9ARCH|nr:MAG: hypothetical protein IPJ89_02805 [Candidatus Diapherotrites archaeon]